MKSPSDDKIKDFINFLDEHKCLKAYEYNRKKYKKAYFEGKRKLNPGFAFIHPRYYASYAFEYWKTPEGFRFWSNIQRKWADYCRKNYGYF